MPQVAIVDFCRHVLRHDRPDRNLPQPHRGIVHPAIRRRCEAIKVKRFEVKAQPAGIGFVEHDRRCTGIDYKTKIIAVNAPIYPKLPALIGKIADGLVIGLIAVPGY